MSKSLLLMVYWYLCTASLCVYGQRTIPFSSLTKLNGLSNNTINDIQQDASGYLWIATNKGLNRFDGCEFKTYQSNTFEVLQSDYILCLALDNKNRLWLGTSNGGLYYLNLIEDKIYLVTEGLREINAIEEREDGHFWLGTGSGLYLMEQNNSGRFALRQFSDLQVKAIEYAKETLWLGTSSGVYYLDQVNQQVTALSEETLGGELVFDMELNNDQELWIATRYQGVIIYNLDTRQLLSIEEKLNPTNVIDFKDARKILKGTNGQLYIGTDGAGLIIYDPLTKKLAQYTNSSNSHSLASNTIFSIYEDRDGSIWLGHIRKGISIIDNNKDEVNLFFRENLSDEHSAILSIYEEKNGDILCGTDGKGLFRINKKNNQFEQLVDHATLSNAYVQSIFRDSKNRLWIGTFSKGIFLQNADTKIRALRTKAVDVRGFCEDENGNIWIGTNGQGLFKYDPNGDITTYKYQSNNSHSISSNYILSLSLFEEKIYLATDGGGLNVLDVETEGIERVMQAEDPNSLLGNNLICLYVQNHDNIWIGSTLGITNIIRENGTTQFIRYSFQDLSFRRFILGILVDENEQVWISTDEGLYRLVQDSKRFLKVNLGSPFNSTEFHYNSCHKFSDGKLFFGSINGLFSFYPEQLFGVQNDHTIAITGFRTFGQEASTEANTDINYLRQINKEGHVTVDASTSFIQIDFSSIQLPSSKEYQYVVQLEHHEDSWQYLGATRTVSYDHLPAGDYIFSVKCIDAFSPKGDHEAHFQITVLTAAWRSWWAMMIYTGLLGGILYLTYSYLQQWRKMKINLKQEKLTREREAALRKMQVTFFTNISHDIRTPLTLILANIRRLTQKQSKGNKPSQELNVIENNINRLLSLSNELLDFRKIETGNFKVNLVSGDLFMLIKESFYAFYDHATQRNIQYELNGIEEALFVLFDYHQLEKVFFNLLSNAFKFTTDGGSIQLTVSNLPSDNLEVRIMNTGPTLSKAQQENIFNRFYQQSQEVVDETIGPGVGIGLSIVKDIVDLHQGRISVESRDGLTSFILFFKKESNVSNIKKEVSHFNAIDCIEQYVAQEKVSIPTLSEIEASEFKDACLLIVEDNYELRKFLVDALQSSYQVLAAENGKQALRLALLEMPDLIISDVMMPEMDGISFCFQIKTNIKTSHIPVILLTARKSRYFKLKGLDTGADDYMNKPFYEDELRIKIRNLLKTRKALRDKFTLEAITKPEEVKLNSFDQEFIQNLCQTIEDNIDDASLKAEQVSQQLNMSHSLVYKKLKSLTGATLVEFIRDYRLQKAEMLLVQDQLTIAEICYQVGFSDRRYFSTCFKNKYQLTPREYLNAKKKST